MSREGLVRDRRGVTNYISNMLHQENNMRDTRPIATPADREAAIAALAEEYAMRRIVGEMHQRGEHPKQRRNEDHADPTRDDENDLWQQVEFAAYHIDGMTLNMKDRLRFDDGNLLADWRFQPLMGLVLDSLRGLRDLFKDETDPNKHWAGFTVRNLLDNLVTAIEVAEQEQRAKHKRLGAHLAEELGLALAEETGNQAEPNSCPEETEAAPAEQGEQGKPDVDDYFGDCPICRRYDGCLNIGRDHWFYCLMHKVKWLVGSNLFSSWRHEDEDQWQRNAAILKDFDEVCPGLLPETERQVAMAKERPEAAPPRDELDDDSLPF